MKRQNIKRAALLAALSVLAIILGIFAFDATAGNVEVASYSLGSATAWSGQGVSWYNLNTSHYYYFKIVKSVGSARLVFTLDCVAQNW